jgi:hypothetical protein
MHGKHFYGFYDQKKLLIAQFFKLFIEPTQVYARGLVDDDVLGNHGFSEEVAQLAS